MIKDYLTHQAHYNNVGFVYKIIYKGLNSDSYLFFHYKFFAPLPTQFENYQGKGSLKVIGLFSHVWVSEQDKDLNNQELKIIRLIPQKDENEEDFWFVTGTQGTSNVRYVLNE